MTDGNCVHTFIRGHLIYTDTFKSEQEALKYFECLTTDHRIIPIPKHKKGELNYLIPTKHT